MVKERRSGGNPSVHGWSRTARSQTWWWASIRRALPWVVAGDVIRGEPSAAAVEPSLPPASAFASARATAEVEGQPPARHACPGGRHGPGRGVARAWTGGYQR